jgi:ABC-type Fe3+-hydroxamate transport system substrate-binding protein
VATVTDDLGATVPLTRPPERVVSLVPSLTESIAATRPGALVGATDWCSHPAGLEVTRVRGTKNPDVKQIIALGPDLVLANQEENRSLDVQRLRAAGVPVWVTVIESVQQAFTSLGRLFEQALGWPVPPWLVAADAIWSQLALLPPRRVVVPIWRDPWMVVGSRTFTGDVLSRLGLTNVYGADRQRYPTVEVADIRAVAPDVVLLPDEPYRFTADDGPEMFAGLACRLVEGRALTWYGPSLADAPAVVAAALDKPLP